MTCACFSKNIYLQNHCPWSQLNQKIESTWDLPTLTITMEVTSYNVLIVLNYAILIQAFKFKSIMMNLLVSYVSFIVMRRPLTSSFQGQMDQSWTILEYRITRGRRQKFKFYDIPTPTGLNFEVKGVKIMGI